MAHMAPVPVYPGTGHSVEPLDQLSNYSEQITDFSNKLYWTETQYLVYPPDLFVTGSNKNITIR